MKKTITLMQDSSKGILRGIGDSVWEIFKKQIGSAEVCAMVRIVRFVLANPYKTMVVSALTVGVAFAMTKREVREFYWRCLKQFAQEWKETWKKEALATVALAIIIFVLQFSRKEADAAKALQDTVTAAVIMLLGWGAYHAVRALWLTPHVRKDDPNLHIDWEGVIYGSLYLSDDGVWMSSASDPDATSYLSTRIRVSNLVVEGKKIGAAHDVSGRVEFTYDTGSPGWRAAPAAWLYEPQPKIAIDPGDDKELILGVAFKKDWSVISNKRRNDGLPRDKTAMEFRDIPWHKATMKVIVIHDGGSQSRQYTWDDGASGVPRIRPLTPSLVPCTQGSLTRRVVACYRGIKTRSFGC